MENQARSFPPFKQDDPPSYFFGTHQCSSIGKILLKEML